MDGEGGAAARQARDQAAGRRSRPHRGRESVGAATPSPAIPEPDRAEPDRAEPNRTEPNRTEPNRTEPDRAGPDRAAPVPDRTLVIWCPDWPILAVGADPDEPAAIADKGLIVACSFAARADGVRRGQKTRDAQRLSPRLALYRRDEGAEARAFEPVLAVLADFSPRVEVLRPGLAAVPLDGPARYFGGEEYVVGAVRDRVGAAGIGVGAGVADGVFAATLAARSDALVPRGLTRAFLEGFPTSVLDRPELTGPLDRLGVRTLGRLAALPADDVAGRFGAAGVAAHRLARGLDARPPAAGRQGPDLSVEKVFDPPVNRSERVVFAAKALADELHEVLAQAGVACVRVAVELHGAAAAGGGQVDRDGYAGGPADSQADPVSHRLWRHDGLLSAAAVAERVRWQLAGWQPHTRPGPDTGEDGVQNRARRDHDHPDSADHGIVLLRLIPDQLVPARGVQPGLWGTDEAPDRVARAAERLQAMLGHQAVTRPARRGGRTPADQGVRTPYGDLPADVADAAEPWPARLPDPAPTGVLSELYPVAVTDAAGVPVTVSGRLDLSAAPAALALGAREELAIASWAGPWPLAERWWDPAHARRRARFQAVTADGRAWLLCVQDGRWHLEAVYG